LTLDNERTQIGFHKARYFS